MGADAPKQERAKTHLVEEIIRHQMENTDIRYLINNWAEEQKDELADRMAITLEKVATVMEVSREMATTLDMERLFSKMVGLFCQLLQAERCTIFLLNEETQELVSGFPHEKRQDDLVPMPYIILPVSEGIAGKVFRTGISSISDDPYHDADFYKEIDEAYNFKTRNILCAPIVDNHGACIGVVEVLNKKNGTFTLADLSLLEALAHQVASAFVNAQLHATITRAREEEAQLLEITTAMSQQLQLVPLLHTIMGTVTNILNADRSTLFMYDAKNQDLWSHVAQGLDGVEIRIPKDKGIAGHVFSTGETVNIPDAYADERFNKEVDKETGYKTDNILCVPVTNKSNEVVGVIQVLNKKGSSFNAMDERRLKAFSSQASVAIQNATLFEDVTAVKNYNERILESMSNGLMTVDDSGNIATANMAALRIFRAETRTWKVLELHYEAFFTEENDWIIQMIKKVLKSGQQDIALNSELILLKKGDVVEHERRRKFATINLTVIPLHGPNKEVLGCMLVIEDITTEKSLRRTMARYLPKEITDKLLAEDSSSLGGKMQKASVLFSDIRAFTHIAEQIGPQKTVSMLNDYFSTMVEIISEHGGILDKYIGDAMMAVFGVPYLQHDDADRALISGIHMLRELAHFNQDWQEKGNDPIRIGIGLNTDLVLSGNIGAPQRMDFTVIGDGVNVASRLETANKFYGTRMLISEYTIAALTETYRFREIDKVLVKGRVEPLTIFEPLATYTEADNDKMTALEPIYQEALGLYKQRQFQQATEAFKDVLAIKDDDPVTQLYLQRCKELVATPPDEDWSGVWSLTEK